MPDPQNSPVYKVHNLSHGKLELPDTGYVFPIGGWRTFSPTLPASVKRLASQGLLRVIEQGIGNVRHEATVATPRKAEVIAPIKPNVAAASKSSPQKASGSSTDSVAPKASSSPKS
jgi:hypothetical protein